MKRMLSLALLVGMSCVACASAPSDATEVAAQADSLSARSVASVRVVPSRNGARRLEMLDSAGRTIAAYYPGFFNANLLVPDVEGNSGQIIVQHVKGTDVLAAAQNPRTGVVAVAVRGFLYAETSFDMVFTFDTRGAAFQRDPHASPTFLPLEGRRADGSIATSADAVRPFRDIQALAYDAAGRIAVTMVGASGVTSTTRYNPDLRLASCTSDGAEGSHCP